MSCLPVLKVVDRSVIDVVDGVFFRLRVVLVDGRVPIKALVFLHIPRVLCCLSSEQIRRIDFRSNPRWTVESMNVVAETFVGNNRIGPDVCNRAVYGNDDEKAERGLRCFAKG